MPGSLFAVYAVLWATLFRALLVQARLAPRTCGRCGRTFERRELGEAICSCR